MIREICFWVAAYWALYLPTSMLLWLITGDGDVLSILFVGVFFTLIVILAFLLLSVIASIVRKKPVEVEEDEKEQTEPIDLEFEPKMHTDVDLGQLDVADDDLLS
jgi:Na+-transporting methylmalonyl-CoA/oxaloacetate decarboxylase gamma subunit